MHESCSRIWARHPRLNDSRRVPWTSLLNQRGHVGFFTCCDRPARGRIAGRQDHGPRSRLLTNLLVGIAAPSSAAMAEVVSIPIFGFWRTFFRPVVGACCCYGLADDPGPKLQ